MKIVEALCLDDVLLVPQYSEIESRKNTILSSILDEKLNISLSLPIIASPMDTISESEMALGMSKNGGLAIIHRYNSIEKQIKLAEEVVKKDPSSIFGCAIGVSGDFIDRVRLLAIHAGVKIFVVDISHGHHILMERAIKSIKDQFGEHVHVMAGNIATSQAFATLENWGADSIRVGIGGGCFVPNSKVLTKNGIKEIKEIKVGEEVRTHKNRFKKVVKIFQFERKEKILNINNKIECTKEHEFYVVEKRHKDIINDDNIHQYAKWIKAKELNKDIHFLIEMN